MSRIVRAIMLYTMLVVVVRAQDVTGLNVTLHTANGLVGKSVMVSILKDGKLVRQSEMIVPPEGRRDLQTFRIEMGQYDVRFEGENMTTVVKQGVHALRLETNLVQVMVQGSGLKTVTYTGTGLIEQLIERIQKLEGTVASLKK